MRINLNTALEKLRNGGVIIFPTDTAFGIGCDATSPKAVEKLFKIKKRSTIKAVPVLFNDIQMVNKYVHPLSREVKELMEKYWPGGLTLVVMHKKNLIPSLVAGGGETIGVRVPDHDSIRTLITELGRPIVGTSANFPSERTPYRFEDIDPRLISLSDGVLEGESLGESTSTIVDCSAIPWKILRKGAVDIKL